MTVFLAFSGNYENAECCKLLIELAFLESERAAFSVGLFQWQISVLCEGQPSSKWGREDFWGLV